MKAYTFIYGPFPLVLLIDDDAVTNFLNKDLIDRVGIAEQVIIAEDGQTGLLKVKELCKPTLSHCPNIIFLDIHMPGMDGFEFLDELKKLEEIYEHLKIFLLSSSNSTRDFERAAKCNLYGIIPKPLTKEKLLKALEVINN